MNIPTLALLSIVVLIALASLVAGLVSSRARTSATWPFYTKRLLTQPEQVLYHRLVKSLPDYVVFAQVQVSRVLGVKKGFKVHEWNNRINRMSYDFVICDKASTVIAAVELDDKSHETKKRVDTDAKKNKATTDAGLRLVRWHVRCLPDELTIKHEFAANRPTADDLRTES